MVDYSAVNARQDACNAQSGHGKAAIRESARILKLIAATAKLGKFTATFSETAFFSPVVLNRLRLLGYKVQIHCDLRDGDYLEVNW